MQHFQLAEIITKDKLVHQGIFFRPTNSGKRAILWVHGLTGRFYGDVALMNLFARECGRRGLGFAAFNNRGHDVVANIRKMDSRKKIGYKHAIYGAGLERFSDCVFDIDAGISYLASQGFSEIVLAGHSTGANKVCYYAGLKRDSRLAGIILAGPMSDRYSTNTDKVNYARNMVLMKKLVADGKGDELLGSRHFFPMTPKRWLSLLEAGSKEDVFNYWDKKGALSVFAKIRKPLLLVFSGEDETADRPIEEIKNIFDSHTKSPAYKSVVIPDTTHSYTGKEKEFVGAVMSWASSL